MDSLTLAVVAYVLGLGILWGYALRLLLAQREAHPEQTKECKP